MIAGPGEHGIVVDPTYGYRHLDPIPARAEIDRYYESEYYDAIMAGGRAQHMRRLIEGGESAESELSWLKRTLYADVRECLRDHAPGTSVLEIGCGTGELLAELAEKGFEVLGIEPAAEAAAVARSHDVRVETASLVEFASAGGKHRFDAAVLANVLEHVPDPLATLELTRGLLRDGGVVWIQVPNDFNRLQLAARERLGHPEWWIAVPDHINYFDFESLGRVLQGLGFESVDVAGDFPMELFLLLGFDYVGNPELGPECHRRRVELELALPDEVRRSLSRALAAEGIARNCRVAARLVDRDAIA